MAIADDETVGVHIRGEHGMQFWLGTGFETEVIALSVADDFLNNRAHLIDLHGEDDEMLCLILILLSRLTEALVGLLDTIVENIWETQ